MTDLKVATIGAGYFARFHHDAWSRMPGVRLAAVCDTDPDRAEAYRAEFGAGAAYTDPATMIAREAPDLVDIAVPPAAHKDLVALAASEKIDTICQKAFTRSLAEAKETVALAEAAGITLVVHENFRFQPWFREIRRLIDEGALGDIYGSSFRLRPGDGQGARAYLDRQPYFQSMERFLMHETGIHFIDTFRFLFGEYASVYADLRQLNPVIAGEDAGIMVLGHAGGVRSLFDGNRLSDHIAENRRLTMGELWVDGSAGTLRLDGEGNLFLRDFGSNDERAHPLAWEKRGFAGDSVYALQSHVVAHLRDGTPLENTGRAYLTNLAVEEAVYRSSAEGGRIMLQGG
ncbi:Gfo/Idh/MocA family protein [Acuticoccus sp. I52.16.1]|uniref:Gfo/Idh/MocA family protein n=1 Tax=Acuticoccus sp. I52.16.1 TaxID=2928472 RepID=UPI001FD5F4CE|nr:Gfo/Idh/MocA family oxidoreductase [Acuticoccus sp. I52.16.1]UOM35683.1 Gfo/Idh/MocA family oxidoreductase [Acuticoccus sp. I52.16.1]